MSKAVSSTFSFFGLGHFIQKKIKTIFQPFNYAKSFQINGSCSIQQHVCATDDVCMNHLTLMTLVLVRTQSFQPSGCFTKQLSHCLQSNRMHKYRSFEQYLINLKLQVCNTSLSVLISYLFSLGYVACAKKRK